MIPNSLKAAMRPVTVIVGHYGAGKTNFTMNLASDLARDGREVTVIDLDIVNPYFRASEQRAWLEEVGVRLIAPIFSEFGTSLDVPSLTGRVDPAIRDAGPNEVVLIDAGGDDVGATALGRYAQAISLGDYAMFYVANRFRNLVSEPASALVNLREIEAASHLQVTALVNNSHLKEATSPETVQRGIAYSLALANTAELPLVCTTVPSDEYTGEVEHAYPVRQLVKSPWE